LWPLRYSRFPCCGSGSTSNQGGRWHYHQADYGEWPQNPEADDPALKGFVKNIDMHQCTKVSDHHNTAKRKYFSRPQYKQIDAGAKVAGKHISISLQQLNAEQEFLCNGILVWRTECCARVRRVRDPSCVGVHEGSRSTNLSMLGNGKYEQTRRLFATQKHIK